MARRPKWLSSAIQSCHHRNLAERLREDGEDIFYLGRNQGTSQRVDKDTGEFLPPFAGPVRLRAVVGNYTLLEIDKSVGLIQVGDKKVLLDPDTLTVNLTTKDVVERKGVNHKVESIDDSQVPFRATVVQLRRMGGAGD